VNITNYIPVIVRYLIVSAMAAIATRGWLSSEQSAILTQNTDIIVSALVGLGTVAYALFKRPSSKALDAAKAIDKQVPSSAPVVIQTPVGVPDIVIPAEKG
jgi:hypothetical protein